MTETKNARLEIRITPTLKARVTERAGQEGVAAYLTRLIEADVQAAPPDVGTESEDTDE